MDGSLESRGLIWGDLGESGGEILRNACWIDSPKNYSSGDSGQINCRILPYIYISPPLIFLFHSNFSTL